MFASATLLASRRPPGKNRGRAGLDAPLAALEHRGEMKLEPVPHCVIRVAVGRENACHPA